MSKLKKGVTLKNGAKLGSKKNNREERRKKMFKQMRTRMV